MALNLQDFLTDMKKEFLPGEDSISYFVRTPDNKLIDVGEELWTLSPVLNVHDPKSGGYKVNSAADTVNTLVAIYYKKDLPSAPAQHITLLSLVYQLQLYSMLHDPRFEEQLSLCKTFEAPLDTKCEPDDVLNAFKLYCELPFRHKRYYRALLMMLSVYSESTYNAQDFMKNALKILEEKLQRLTDLNLEMLPAELNFAHRRASICIMDVRGVKKTGVYFNKAWIPVELFGREFDIRKLNIKNFYLKYGRYVIFQENSSVFYKDITRSGNARLLLKNCEQLLARQDHVFVLTHEDADEDGDGDGDGRSILKWDGENFKLVYQSTDLGPRIDFDGSTNFLACLKSSHEGILILQYQDDTLTLCRTEDITKTKLVSCQSPSCGCNYYPTIIKHISFFKLSVLLAWDDKHCLLINLTDVSGACSIVTVDVDPTTKEVHFIDDDLFKINHDGLSFVQLGRNSFVLSQDYKVRAISELTLT